MSAQYGTYLIYVDAFGCSSHPANATVDKAYPIIIMRTITSRLVAFFIMVTISFFMFGGVKSLDSQFITDYLKEIF